MRLTNGLLATMALTAALAAPASAHGGGSAAYDHVGTLTVPDNLRPAEPRETITSAEIVAAVPGGRTLIYTDSPAGRVGFIDISDARDPDPGGVVDIGGEPTSVATVGRHALVAVNTSPSFARRAASSRSSTSSPARSPGGSRSPASPTRSRSRPTSATPRW